MHVFINELSFQSQTNNVSSANRLMDDLLTVIRLLEPIKGTDPIHTSMTLWQRELSPGFNVHQWLYQTRRDQMLRLIVLITKGPYIETLLDDELSNHECWFRDNDVSSSSLAGSVYFDGILTSLKESLDFNSDTVQLKYREEEEILKDIEIFNLYEPINVPNIVNRITRDILRNISSWQDLWEQKNLMFPMLSFCDCVKVQLGALSFAPTNMKIIKEHLTKMNAYCERLDREDITPDYTKMGISASKETEITLKQYGHQRIFVCPDGDERLFEWHTKQIGQNIRIHFYPLSPDSNTILIGYIGPHLNTYSYH